MKLVALVVGLVGVAHLEARASPVATGTVDVGAGGSVTIGAEVTIDVDVHAQAHAGAGAGGDADAHVDAGADAQSTSLAREPEASPGVAVSSMVVDAAANANPLLAPHWEASIGMSIPTDLGGPGPGLTASLGRQIGALRLSADYVQLARDSSGPMTSSTAIAVRCLTRAHRLGATARYRVAYGAGIAAFGAYVEGGLGRETYATKVGPTVARSVAIGAGFESLIGGRGGTAGFDMGYRALIDIDDGETAHLITLSMLLGR